MARPELAAEIDDAAADWVAKLCSNSVSDAERRAFEVWISQSDRHSGAYARARAVWLGLGAGEDAFQRLSVDNDPEADGSPTRDRLAISRRAAIAAGVSAVVLGAWSLMRQSPQTTRFTTDVGEQRRLLLGSSGTVLMNTQSTLALTGASPRSAGKVEILDGEALFSISHAPDALQIECPDVTIRCMDAVFSVGVDRFETTVTVTRGFVGLVGAGLKEFVLAPGDQALVGQGAATVRKIGQEAADRSIAWTSGYLIFSGETLAEAAASINRYNRLQVTLGTAVPAQDAVVGRFSINDPRAFATAVAKIYALTLSVQGDRLILTGSAPK